MNSRLSIAVLTASLLGGCVSTQEIASASDYRLCRARILRPMSYGISGLKEVEQQIDARKLDCTPHMSSIMVEKASQDKADQNLRDYVAEQKRIELERKRIEASRRISCTSQINGNIVNTDCR